MYTLYKYQRLMRGLTYEQVLQEPMSWVLFCLQARNYERERRAQEIKKANN